MIQYYIIFHCHGNEYYIIFINLFYLVVDKLKSLKDNEYFLKVEVGIELFNDLKNLRLNLLSRLDPFLRQIGSFP